MNDCPELQDGPQHELVSGADVVPPMLPSRAAFLLAFSAVVLAGILGAIIGFGIADVTSDSGVAQFMGAVIGAVIGAGGVGIVAVLALRAMAEWKRNPNPRPKGPARS